MPLVMAPITRASLSPYPANANTRPSLLNNLGRLNSQKNQNQKCQKSGQKNLHYWCDSTGFSLIQYIRQCLGLQHDYQRFVILIGKHKTQLDNKKGGVDRNVLEKSLSKCLHKLALFKPKLLCDYFNAALRIQTPFFKFDISFPSLPLFVWQAGFR